MQMAPDEVVVVRLEEVDLVLRSRTCQRFGYACLARFVR
jgi:hypothetical protein